MQNKKLLSVVASLALAASLAVPVSAADEFLPDVANVSATSVPEGIKISWDAVENADRYTIYYGSNSVVEDGGSYEENITVSDMTEHTVENLLADTIYYFAVAADDSTGIYLGSYNYSNEVSTIAGEAVANPDPDPDPDEDLPVVDTDEITSETIVALPEDEEEDEATLPEDEEEDEATLPDSGPATAAVLIASAGGAYFYRKLRK